MRRFVIIGRKATASDDFRLDDLPGTSGRLDVLLRCVRAAMLFSHGLRRDVVVYLVLCAGERAPRAMRFSGVSAKFIRPDERALAVLAKKVLVSRADEDGPGFIEVKPGIALSSRGLAAVLADLGTAAPHILEENGENGKDVREIDGLAGRDVSFFLGDHCGFDEATRASLVASGARSVSVGPVSLHAEDVIAVVSNEIDRREARGPRVAASERPVP